MAAINIVGQRAEEEIDIDNVPPPSPELVPPPRPELVPPPPPEFLPPDSAVPDPRQQDVYSQFASSQEQTSQNLTSGKETVHMPPPEKAVLANATLSKPIEVKLV